MSIINNRHPILNIFKSYEKDYWDVFEYIRKFDLEKELIDILNANPNCNDRLYDALLRFSFKYGILSITRFIYEHLNHTFEMHMLTEYVGTASDSQNKDISYIQPMVAVGGDGSDTSSLKFSIEDKYSKCRNECITYILNMKKFSTYISSNKKFYYRFNKSRYGNIRF